MRLFRLLLAWMLMAALPLQGFAAASMVLCGAAGASAPQVAHAHDGGHAMHAHHQPPEQAADTAADGLQSATHACSICATCCNAAALPAVPHASPVLAPAHAFAHERAGSLIERPSSVIERPPRS